MLLIGVMSSIEPSSNHPLTLTRYSVFILA
jgi:hypothetical protein